jgi:hypothetical protein
MTSELPHIPEPNLSSNEDDSFFDSLESQGVNSEISESDSIASVEDEKKIPNLESETKGNLNQGEADSPLFSDAWADDSDLNEPSLSITDESDSSSTKSTVTKVEPELFVDRWLDESDAKTSSKEQVEQLTIEVKKLEQQKQALKSEIRALEAQKEQLVTQQMREAQENLGRMVEEGMRELKERKTALQIEIEKLERRRERIRQEMRTNFAGVSQELAIRVQGFKDYLVGSLQDLAAAAEQLQLPTAEPKTSRIEAPPEKTVQPTPQPQFAQGNFVEQERRIRNILEQYRNQPDYYGSPWQLRRTFEPIHAERVQSWFFTQGGRGAIKSMGSRLQNILVASAVISVLNRFYGDRCRTLILSDTPERLGEWRRGLQDCLGISRSDFSPNRGIGLFEAPEALVQKAERLLEEKLLPLVIIDETEERVSLSLLQFPLWLAFVSEPQSTSSYLY